MGEKVEQIPNTSSVLGEGPLWSKTGVLYWVDIKSNKVNEYDPEKGTNTSHQLDQNVTAIVLRKSGGALIAVKHGLASFDLNTGKYDIIARPDADPRNRFNDAKCDNQGRFWAGTMEDAETGANLGALYSLDEKLQVTKHLSDLGVSNGLCWTADSKTMYFIDSPTKKVDAFDFDAATGKLSNRRTAVTIPEDEGFPDGMTIDADGNIWVAHWGGSRITQWDPHSGKLLRTVKMPTAKVTSVAFGGKDFSDLYATTASVGSEPPPAGALFRITGLGVKGLPASEFAG